MRPERATSIAKDVKNSVDDNIIDIGVLLLIAAGGFGFGGGHINCRP